MIFANFSCFIPRRLIHEIIKTCPAQNPLLEGHLYRRCLQVSLRIPGALDLSKHSSPCRQDFWKEQRTRELSHPYDNYQTKQWHKLAFPLARAYWAKLKAVMWAHTERPSGELFFPEKILRMYGSPVMGSTHLLARSLNLSQTWFFKSN